MVVKNFLLLVLSSFFQIPSFSPVCSSSVFSFTFKIFETFFCSYLSIVPVFPPYFVICVPYCHLFCLSRHSYHFILCRFPRFSFFPSFSFLLSPLYPPDYPFLYFIRFHFLCPFPLPFSVFCPLPVASCLQVRANTHATPRKSNQPLTSRLPLSHGSPSNLLWVVL